VAGFVDMFWDCYNASSSSDANQHVFQTNDATSDSPSTRVLPLGDGNTAVLQSSIIMMVTVQ